MEAIDTLEPGIKRKSELEILSDDLVSLFERVIPAELRTRTYPVDVVSVASGPFVKELAAVYSTIPGIRQFRAIDQGIPSGLLRIMNEDSSQYPGFQLENGDVADPAVLGQAVYDVAILRNPQIASLSGGPEVNPVWTKIMNNTLSCVKEGGFLIMSGHTEDEFHRSMEFIQRSRGFEVVKMEDPIKPQFTSRFPLVERSVAVLRKGYGGVQVKSRVSTF